LVEYANILAQVILAVVILFCNTSFKTKRKIKMSLEDNIKELTLAIHKLTVALDVTTASVTPASTETVFEVELEAAPPKKAKPELKAVPIKEAPADTPEVTREKLKALCLDLVRKDRENSPKVKAIIASFGGTLVSDVSTEKLPELAKQLLALGA
jgi:hypothetical protein